MTLLLTAGRLLMLALLGAVSLVSESGMATRFGDPGDRLTGEQLYCTQQKLAPGQLVCAHRTLPCGSVLMLHNPRTSRYALCEVLDRGPFGAIMPTGEWGFKIRREEPGNWRGIIDLSPAVADALGFNGMENVQVIYKKLPKHFRSARRLLLAREGEPAAEQ